jgi:hypothetical protein
MTPDHAYLAADQADAHAALTAATALRTAGALPEGRPSREWLTAATEAYRWLRSRDSLKAVVVHIVPGVPFTEGRPEVATLIPLADNLDQPFTLTGTDVKGASVPLETGFTAAWVLTDPDTSGAVLTVSADTASCTVAAGTPTDNLSLGVTVTNADGSALTGVEAIQVTATAAVSVAIVAGTPAAETPPAG